MPERKEIQKTIDHLFWDSPIYACLVINGTDYHHDELDGDSYEWKRDEFLKSAAEKSGVSQEILAAIVPKELNY